jgi:hypothetical protein
VRRWLVGSAAALGLIMSACGEAQPTKTVTVTTSTTATGTTAAANRSARHASADGARSARRRSSKLTACDSNIRVKAATTTCAFAENVFYEYWRWLEYREVSDVEAYSPKLKTYLPVECKDTGPVTCRTHAGALVRFPASAVEAYTVDDAATYAASHTVSKDPNAASDDAAAPSDEHGDCDPNYEGACLDPAASDYDCEGGSGDGPEYTGTVTVVGDDHFDLDRDGDGVGCHS